MLIHEVHAIEGSENEDSVSVQDSSSALLGAVSVMAFIWEDTATYEYLGRRQFIGNCSPQNKAKNVTEGVDAFQRFYTQKLIGIIVHETNNYAE